jgi:putative ABC transport system ATP-binding protein
MKIAPTAPSHAPQTHEWPGIGMNNMADTVSAIEARGLTKIVSDATGSLIILDDINLAIATGETAAIVGASGSGKSTLLGLLAGLDVPTRGEVRIDGENLFARDEDGRARLRAAKIGFVFQSFQLLPHLTALENVLLPLELAGLTGNAAGIAPRAAATELLARVGLAQRLHHYPRTLSGGEQQRVALARAFVNHPPILMADEPTGSLDERTGAAVIALMFELNREHGSTLLLVTHDTGIAARCGRRIELHSGRIAASPLAAGP